MKFHFTIRVIISLIALWNMKSQKTMTSRIFCLIFFFTKKIANYLFDFVIQCERLSKDRQKNRHGWPQDLLFHWLLSIRESRVPIVRRNVFKTISRYRVVRFRVTKLVLSVSGQRIRIRARLSFLITCLHFSFSIITCIRSFDNVKHSKTFENIRSIFLLFFLG